MTEEQIQKALKYLIRAATADKVDIFSVELVLRWVIENPLPDDFEAQTDAADEEALQLRITNMRKTLNRLEGR